MIVFPSGMALKSFHKNLAEKCHSYCLMLLLFFGSLASCDTRLPNSYTKFFIFRGKPFTSKNPFLSEIPQ